MSCCGVSGGLVGVLGDEQGDDLGSPVLVVDADDDEGVVGADAKFSRDQEAYGGRGCGRRLWGSVF